MCPSVLLETCLCEAYEGGLMGHFGVQKTLDTLKEHFYLPNMKKDVQKFFERCIVCKKSKSKVMPHGLYTLYQFRILHGLIYQWTLF